MAAVPRPFGGYPLMLRRVIPDCRASPVLRGVLGRCDSKSSAGTIPDGSGHVTLEGWARLLFPGDPPGLRGPWSGCPGHWCGRRTIPQVRGLFWVGVCFLLVLRGHPRPRGAWGCISDTTSAIGGRRCRGRTGFWEASVVAGDAWGMSWWGRWHSSPAWVIPVRWGLRDHASDLISPERAIPAGAGRTFNIVVRYSFYEGNPRGRGVLPCW